jgi:hypothetical protein
MGVWTDLFGMNGTQIYHNFRGGTGDDARGLIGASAQVVLLTSRYKDRTDSITKLTTKMESAWQGDAAGAAQRGAGPLAVEHGLAQEGMTTAHTTLYNQARAFVAAKDSVTEVPPTPDKPGVWDNVTSFGGAGRNYETQMTQVTNANDNNVAVMEQYETTTSSNVSAMPTTYGRITDDYAAVGVDKPTPPPPSQPYNPPVFPAGRTPGGQTGGTGTGPSGTGGSTTPPGGTRTPPGGGNQTSPGGGTQTNPSNNRPPVRLPPRTPVPSGQNPGQGGNPALPGMLPPPGFGPGGGPGGMRPGGGSGSFGPRGSGGFGPGGSGGPGSTGGPGAGRGPGAGGFGPGAGGAAAAENAAARGGMGAGAGGRGGFGGMGGMGGAHGNKGQGENDAEHERPSFLVEPDPHETFGSDEVTAPPVIGE